MRYGLEQADEGGWEAYLEASPDAVRLYTKHGFEEAEVLDTLIRTDDKPDGVVYRNVFMIRKPKPKS